MFANPAIYNVSRIKQRARDNNNIGYFRVNLQPSSQQRASLSRKPTRSLTPNDSKMAAFFKAVNAKIRANPMLSYVCSTRTFTLPIGLPAGFTLILWIWVELREESYLRTDTDGISN